MLLVRRTNIMAPKSSPHAFKTALPQTPLSIAYLETSSLRPNPKNPRQHSDKQIQQIARSIEAFGFIIPVVIDSASNVIAGHGRVLAAKSLNIAKLPTIRLEHLTETQAKAFTIADNRISENSVWDDQLLAEQLKFLSDVGIGCSLDVIGFEVGEIDLLIEGSAPAIEGESDPADVLPAIDNPPQISQPGDLWILGRHRIYCGNSLESTSYTMMEGDRAHAIFTDPPYNVRINGHATGLGAVQHKNFKMASGEMSVSQFTDFLAQAFILLAAHSRDGSLHYIFMDWRHLTEILDAGKQVYTELKNVCIWNKGCGGMGSFYRSAHELVFVFKHGVGSHRNNVQLGQFGRYRTNVWSYPGTNSFARKTDEGNLSDLHPTVKPVALVADALMDCTARRDIVLDPFLGSGTTAIAAERTGRVCYGIEIDPQYVDTAVRRWQDFTGLDAKHRVSGRTFNELAEEADLEHTEARSN
jgi:DNA modification methylase